MEYCPLTAKYSVRGSIPWCSPEIWKRIVDFYMVRPTPTVFEYGAGASSIHHIRNLLKIGGTYIGVEHEVAWYSEVVNAIVRYAVHHNLAIEFQGDSVQMPSDFPVAAHDVVFHLKGERLLGCIINLKLRPPYNRTQDADGTLAEFREYVYSLQEQADVVIVDGRARKPCINYRYYHDLSRAVTPRTIVEYKVVQCTTDNHHAITGIIAPQA